MSFWDIFHISKIKQENEFLRTANAQLVAQIRSLGVTEYQQTRQKIENLERESANRLNETNRTIQENNSIVFRLREEINALQEKNSKLEKAISSQERKLSRCKELYKSVDYSISNFFNSDVPFANCKLSVQDFNDLELIIPSVELKLHCMDIKSLRKAFKENEKQIDKVLEQYSARYTTKANTAIYNLMIIALRAELQNILYNLKYEKLDKSIEDVKTISAKYLKIAGEGNQSIVGTLTKFIGEIEYLFINAVKIEYNYYVKKEQARQEQQALREQMRQEAAERKALEEERKKVEQEESKYQAEIDRIKNQIENATASEIELLNAKILELQVKLSDVVTKKEEITSLQNGKAGTVYIISNLGSFGENVFKVGMTRRIEPQDRVNELGDASVPFKFDVHSFIFSEDAVSLENKMHRILENNRVNKVNPRKEFFYISIDELEKIVYEIEPTAEFTKTMLAEEYRQSISTSESYTSDYCITDEDEE